MTGRVPPEVQHFINSARKLPDGRWHVDFATARHAVAAARLGAKADPNRSEFVTALSDDLKEATGRAGTRADWIEAEGDRPAQPARPETFKDGRYSRITDNGDGTAVVELPTGEKYTGDWKTIAENQAKSLVHTKRWAQSRATPQVKES